MDLLLFIVFRILRFLLLGIPRRMAISFLALGIRCFALCSSRHVRVARKNLALAFPEMPEQEREKIFKRSYREIARLIYDALRIPCLSPEWYEKHITFPHEHDFRRILEQGHGALLAVGHLGSFELLAQYCAIRFQPLHLVIRSFRAPRLDAWWNRMRSWNGNVVLRRDGAFRLVVKHLRRGDVVALPFDQNVRRSFAVFVKFFGRDAATTRALGLAALASRAPVLVSSLTCEGNDCYRVEWAECPLQDIYNAPAMTNEEKQVAIAQRVSDAYAEMIRKNPSAWFWMHRRWKTTPREDMPEDFYDPDRCISR